MPGPISTSLTQWLGIDHPILLAGMNVAAGPALAAAVTNAGGLGVIGGVGYTPKVLRNQIKELKKDLKNPNAPFGVDLLLPQVGGNARKTNYDYTKGQLPELIDVIIEEKAALFVSAVGVPPKEVMVGHTKHIPRALDVGVDIICAQGGEGGGHTGDIASSILIPACVDAVKGRKSPLTGGPVYVVAAGGIYDGRGLAANLMYGAQAVWVGTRFVASKEAGAPPKHKELVVAAGHEDITRTLIYTGRPLRVYKTPYVADWEENRREEIKELTSKGILPAEHDLEKNPGKSLEARTFLMGSDVLPAKTIIDNMVKEAVERLQAGNTLLVSKAKL
ncbi:2-nitropropane dioxygenase [Rhizoctonia solani]|uniref:2-nitropropane dioxygenase n=1 Tax=Rhizoctonia solani TaxID=456999 RepID=A0A8H7M7U7_9AGAM|nr:2-nitropropane dioxygenase [Rhizoctonia solani]